jgi:hypothetical protein
MRPSFGDGKMINADDIKKLIDLKASDKKVFYDTLKRLSNDYPSDPLLNFSRFKQYPSAV